MREMFCFQCQQTAHNTGCDGKAGVCGKKADTANYQDELIGALIGLARAARAGTPTPHTDARRKSKRKRLPSAPGSLTITTLPRFGRRGRTCAR